MTDTLIRLDQQLLLALNGSDSEWLDHVVVALTATTTWLPLALVLICLLARNAEWRRVLLCLVGVALVVLVADRVSSGLCKPLFHRFRPSHEPLLEGLIDLVADRRGGLYGFISSHAANTFGVATYLSLTLRSRAVRATLFTWACISSYTRIYLGLHYPGDIICGALFGILTGYLSWRLSLIVSRRLTITSEPITLRHPDDLFLPAALLLTLLVVMLLAL